MTAGVRQTVGHRIKHTSRASADPANVGGLRNSSHEAVNETTGAQTQITRLDDDDDFVEWRVVIALRFGRPYDGIHKASVNSAEGGGAGHIRLENGRCGRCRFPSHVHSLIARRGCTRAI